MCSDLIFCLIFNNVKVWTYYTMHIQLLRKKKPASLDFRAPLLLRFFLNLFKKSCVAYFSLTFDINHIQSMINVTFFSPGGFFKQATWHDEEENSLFLQVLKCFTNMQKNVFKYTRSTFYPENDQLPMFPAHFMFMSLFLHFSVSLVIEV